MSEKLKTYFVAAEADEDFDASLFVKAKSPESVWAHWKRVFGELGSDDLFHDEMLEPSFNGGPTEDDLRIFEVIDTDVEGPLNWHEQVKIVGWHMQKENT